MAAVKAFFLSSPAEYYKEQAKFLQMQKDFVEWQKNGGAAKYTGADLDKFMGQAGVDGPKGGPGGGD